MDIKCSLKRPATYILTYQTFKLHNGVKTFMKQRFLSLNLRLLQRLVSFLTIYSPKVLDRTKIRIQASFFYCTFNFLSFQIFFQISIRDIHIASLTYRVLQTIQMKLILLCVWAERAILGSAKTALKFKYEIQIG